MNTFIVAKQLTLRLLGKKKTWVLLFIVPSLLLSLIMGLLHFEVSGTPTIPYVDQDHSIWSEALLDSLAQSFQLVELKDAKAIEALVTERKHKAAFYIPAGYGEMIQKQASPKLRIVSLGINEAAITLQLAAEQASREWLRVAAQLEQEQAVTSDKIQAGLQRYLAFKPSFEVKEQAAKAPPNLRTAMGIFMIFILYNALNAVIVMKEDKQNMLMSRVYAAPVRAWEIAAGYYIGIVIYGTIQLIIVLLITRGIMGIPMGIGAIEQFVMLELFLCAGISIGCMLGSLIASAAHFSNMGFAFIFPASMIGGCFWPIEMMKPYMQQLSYAVPQRWALDGIELLAAGNSLSSIWLHLVVLCLFTLFFLCLGSVVLQPSAKESLR
ncbi:ABC transporter permease [Paenibacillus aquistagni]|uniref:ABC-2 type transport system permease protein n=1 Tax=Paenibacillus aquistagni TaxID=1852522 RepID=A0A1X7JCQ6_9BACL|nr:ABC transporter permease [Paenibacillus aquistagni]SMG25566.1 ABC-2 type transport system permease protein [Paenibacillus aquistagni]